MKHWIIFEFDKLVPNMDKIEMKSLKGFKGDELKILKYSSYEDAEIALETTSSSAFKAKNKNKKCNYIILQVYD